MGTLVLVAIEWKKGIYVLIYLHYSPNSLGYKIEGFKIKFHDRPHYPFVLSLFALDRLNVRIIPPFSIPHYVKLIDLKLIRKPIIFFSVASSHLSIFLAAASQDHRVISSVSFLVRLIIGNIVFLFRATICIAGGKSHFGVHIKTVQSSVGAQRKRR